MEQVELYNYKDRYERRVNGIKESENISQQNKKLFLDFLVDTSATVTDGRVQKYAFLLLNIGKLADKDFRKMKDRDYRILVKKIDSLRRQNGKPISEWYKADTRTALKVFIKWLYGKKYKAQDFEWLRTSLPQNVKRSRVEEGQAPTIEEIEKIISFTDNTRDKALIASAYETGARPSEILTLRVGSIKFDANGGTVYIQQSKTKPRKIRIISSSPYLRAWINIHPFKDNPEAMLWIRYRTTPSGNETIGIPAFNKLLKTSSRRAGIKKRMYSYILRHARITHLLQQYPDQIVKRISGHSPTSKHFDVYNHITDEDVDRAILERNGLLKPADEVRKELEKPLVCWNCSALNTYEAKVCEKCNFSLDLPSTMQKMKKFTPMLEALTKMSNMPDEKLVNIMKAFESLKE